MHFFFFALFFCSVAGSVYVEAFDEIVSGPVAQYLSLSQKIGGDVQKHVRYSSDAKQCKMCLFNTATEIISGSVGLLMILPRSSIFLFKLEI